MKYLAWCPRPTDDLTSIDTQVRERAGVEIGDQYPVQGWAFAAKSGGGAVSVSSEKFAGSEPVWIWQG